MDDGSGQLTGESDVTGELEAGRLGRGWQREAGS